MIYNLFEINGAFYNDPIMSIYDTQYYVFAKMT